jgi:cyclopropane fatty-acyl-phospholipid synthase-like methyltransferase
MLRKILSYFIPVNVHRESSEINESLEVTWANGNLVLDSAHTNYSYGSLQRVLRNGLLEIGFGKVSAMESALVLGVGGGSVVRTLADEIRFGGKVTGVEIDPKVLELAKRYFSLDKIPNLKLIQADARSFVQSSPDGFDLIVIDVFVDRDMPGFLFEKEFAEAVQRLVNKNGYVLFNTLVMSDLDDMRNDAFKSWFEPGAFDVKTLPRMERHNELILIEKN